MKKLTILLGVVAILILMAFPANAWRVFDGGSTDRESLRQEEDRQNLRDLNQWRLKEEREDLLRQHQEAIDQIEDRRRSRQDRYDWERDEYGEDKYDWERDEYGEDRYDWEKDEYGEDY